VAPGGVLAERLGDERALGRPPPVGGAFADLGPAGDLVEGQAAVADFTQNLLCGLQDGLVRLLAAGAAGLAGRPAESRSCPE
jgi:hypothetical protein